MKSKYASEDFEDPDVEIVFAGGERKPKAQKPRPIMISGKEAEEVGFDKIRKQLANLHELRIVILDGLCMSRPISRLKQNQGFEGLEAWPTGCTDVRDACPKVNELDLSRNLFEEWREVASICEQLDELRSLRVEYVSSLSDFREVDSTDDDSSGNRFRDTTITASERERCLKAFQHVKTLKLENALLSWEEVGAGSLINVIPTNNCIDHENHYSLSRPYNFRRIQQSLQYPTTVPSQLHNHRSHS